MNEYNDNQSFFKQLLQKYHSVTDDQKNVEILATEIFNLKNIALEIMIDIFKLKEPYTTYIQNHITSHTKMLRLHSIAFY